MLRRGKASQFRRALRFSALTSCIREPDAADPLAKQNPHATAGWNRVVMGDGRIQPLLPEGSTPDPIIPLEKFRNASPKVTPRGGNGDIIPTD